MRLIVIGASTGGVAALGTLVQRLPADLPAPVLVVLHVGDHNSVLPQILSRQGPLPARHAAHGDALQPGQILVAPPDRHLVVDGRTVQVTQGPKEHHTRPAIDPLFRSAAVSHGAGVVGVILTGMLDDGTAGMRAIQDCGGVLAVQDPDDAEAPGMPSSVLRHLQVDCCAGVAELADFIVRMAGTPVPKATPGAAEPAASQAIPGAATSSGSVMPSQDADDAPPDHMTPDILRHEIAIFEGRGDAMAHLRSIGEPSTFTCPDCHGVLWRVHDRGLVRFRCHVGHGFSLQTVVNALKDARESALWSALRATREQEMLLEQARSELENESPDVAMLNSELAVLQLESASLRALIEGAVAPPQTL